ncbi:MAG: hypothetical protein D6732_29165, partial [Methanobacteriota archaeon]
QETEIFSLLRQNEIDSFPKGPPWGGASPLRMTVLECVILRSKGPKDLYPVRRFFPEGPTDSQGEPRWSGISSPYTDGVMRHPERSLQGSAPGRRISIQQA